MLLLPAGLVAEWLGALGQALEVAPVVMERGSEANSELHCPVKVWAGLGAFRLNAGAEVSQKENCSFFFCNYHPNACLLISSLLPSSTEEGFCA